MSNNAEMMDRHHLREKNEIIRKSYGKAIVFEANTRVLAISLRVYETFF